MTETLASAEAPPIDLAALFGFSADDLAANRAGRLSAEDKRRVLAKPGSVRMANSVRCCGAKG